MKTAASYRVRLQQNGQTNQHRHLHHNQHVNPPSPKSDTRPYSPERTSPDRKNQKKTSTQYGKHSSKHQRRPLNSPRTTTNSREKAHGERHRAQILYCMCA